ncbi:MAG: aminopeptidase P family protein [Deltaproteobacteria bacterium]|nr:MAG: aminopeptidase P family protein [Deltaproteobacteria bacterium]
MTPNESSVFQQRREALAKEMGPNTLGVWRSQPVRERTRDVAYPYQPNPDVFYLSGCEEPSAVLMLDVSSDGLQTSLFVEEGSEESVVWEGPKPSLEEWKEVWGVDHVFPLAQADETISSHLSGKQTFFVTLGAHDGFEKTALRWMQQSSQVLQTRRYIPTGIVDASPYLQHLREHKDAWEVGQLRQAAAKTIEAHKAIMQTVSPGQTEAEVEALFGYELARRGCRQLSFPTIVAGGSNATILHYRDNDQPLPNDGLLLLDGGGEWGRYAADVSRTFPVNGVFSERQREVYEIALSAHQAALRACFPGSTWEAVHQAAVSQIVQGLVRLGVLEGEVEALVESKAYQPYFPHNTSHWLGLEVHDVGARLEEDGGSRVLHPGMVFTVEPGLYFNSSLNPKQTKTEWEGIGVRIEDNILITDDGHENLTVACPVSVEAIEALMRL